MVRLSQNCPQCKGLEGDQIDFIFLFGERDPPYLQIPNMGSLN